jgi:hypothetical protein
LCIERCFRSLIPLGKQWGACCSQCIWVESRHSRITARYRLRRRIWNRILFRGHGGEVDDGKKRGTKCEVSRAGAHYRRLKKKWYAKLTRNHCYSISCRPVTEVDNTAYSTTFIPPDFAIAFVLLLLGDIHAQLFGPLKFRQ